MSGNPISKLKILLDENNIWEGEREVDRNEYLVKQGTLDSRMYFVLSGSLRAIMDVDDKEHTIRLGYKGSIFGSLDSFLSGKRSLMSIQAIKKSKLLYTSRTRLMNFFKSTPERLIMWSELQNTIILQQLEREVDLLTVSPEKRYQRVLARSPHLFQHIPNKYIASYLRMTPETLSRISKS